MQDRMPNPSPWRKARDLHDQALQLPEAERDGFLAKACQGDADLRQKVDNLLNAGDEGATLTTNPVITALAEEQVISHYRVVRKLGEGGTGVVYKAVDEALGRSVALKVLTSIRGNERERERFRREAKAVSALNHSNIVTVYEFGTDNGIDFIAMEYVEGLTLRKHLVVRDTSFEVLLDYVAQAAKGVQCAHRAGIVHRDLKPDNIMVTDDGVVKVLDFGLAKRQDGPEDEHSPLTRVGTVVGTPAYMAPEQAMGETIGPAADIFALGVILYELACGKRPFEGKTAHAILHEVTQKIQTEPAVLNPSIPRSLTRLIDQCLEKDPSRRPTAADVVSALATIPPTAPPKELKARSASRRWFGAVGGLAVVGLAIALWLRPTPKKPFEYSIEAQQMKDGVPVGDPYTASVGDAFQAGWRFRMRLRATEPGRFYVLNQGPAEAGSSRMWMLYPPATDKNSGTQQEVLTGWYRFDQNPGTETMWVVWSRAAVEILDQSAASTKDGELKALDSIRRFLAKPEAATVESFQLNHR